MLDAEEPDGDICAALDDYTEASGLATRYYLGGDALIITIGEGAPGA